MSKIALTADWHARGKDLPAFTRQLGALVAECNARAIDLLCVAGDIFDSAAVQDPNGSTGYIARAVLEEVWRLRSPVLMIPGNHDSAGSGSADALYIVTERATDDGCRIIHEPGWTIYDKQRDGLDLAVCCVPWAWSGDPFPKPWSAEFTEPPTAPDFFPVQPGRKTLLLAHVQVGGAVMNDGYACPDKPGKFQISRADLAAMPFDHFALGDFHKRQDLTDGRGGYVGALRQCDFGEENNPAGFEIWDTETGETNWIELDAAPRHKTFILAPGDPSPPAPPEGWLYKVRLTGAQLDLVQARDLERDGHQVEYRPDFVERIARAEIPPNVINDPLLLMALWTEANDIGDDRLARMLEVWENLGGDENESQEPSA